MPCGFSSGATESIFTLLMHDVFNRPRVAGAVLQSASSLIKSLNEPFPPNLQNIINHNQKS